MNENAIPVLMVIARIYDDLFIIIGYLYIIELLSG
jgi:hypothetical protein